MLGCHDHRSSAPPAAAQAQHACLVDSAGFDLWYDRGMNVDFRTHPDRYQHWQLTIEGQVARLGMDVDEAGGLGPWELKMNSYDLGVDIELYDAVQRVRFEHPEVKVVVIESLKERIFCAGANIKMLGKSTHPEKVNFCKFTNETRNGVEDASINSGQRYLAAINGSAAGGGYELALATDHIILVDDGAASVALPEVPLLGVVPGTGGLTRLVDKRFVRRDLADVFSTVEEGIKGRKAVEWRLVDETIPTSRFTEAVDQRLAEMAETSDRPSTGPGIELTPLQREITESTITYSSLRIELDRDLGTATIVIDGPTENPPAAVSDVVAAGVEFWPLEMTRSLDDAILHLRTNEREIGTWLLKTEGDLDIAAAHDAFLLENIDHWAVREIVLYIKRTLRRLDVTSRTTFTLVEPGSCFVGSLAELAFAADRCYMLEGTFEGSDLPEPKLRLTAMNLGPLTMDNHFTRLATRFWGRKDAEKRAEALISKDLDALEAFDAELVTFAYDDIDWSDELRIALEERASFSPDALTGMEANLRFPGPETLETKIFGRLTAWQNWIFTRPNASGPDGALQRYGTGLRPDFNRKRT
ncbi:MAG: 2,3-epoxybenzoyl-CoA dihydrolase [Acidimicrobiia bacterium]|nr:MAG: 2,3-epoxybenzoyl-CoA dihydrolase [Acidimicrobiia bacterium]